MILSILIMKLSNCSKKFISCNSSNNVKKHDLWPRCP